jgi:hypothetical protein
MKMRSAIVLGMVLLCGAVAFAQDSPKAEISIVYSYIDAHPQNSNIIKPFSLDGGGVGGAFFFSKYIGIEAEFNGYASFSHSIIIPAGNPACLGAVNCTLSATGDLFSYNVGPIVKFRVKHFEPFIETMFGGAHTDFYGSIFSECGATIGCVSASRSPSNNAWDFIIGGGIDIPIGRSFAIRPVEVDYMLTRFGTGFTGGNNNQSNFRYQGGVLFRF